MHTAQHPSDTLDCLPDHRRLGRDLGLFAGSDLLGPGLPLWLPHGSAVRDALERWSVDTERRAGWQHVHTPPLAKRALYERSGHWQHYRDDMFPPLQAGHADGGEDLVLRPMNCPHHALVYAAEPRSWRELPLRLAERGQMFRDERSGVIGGMSRVRVMTLNDGHIFCAEADLEAEIAAIIGMICRAYHDLGIRASRWRLSLPDPASAKYVDDPGMWEAAEQRLRSALSGCGKEAEPAAGEAAFYGPKLDVQVRDALGREETLSTVQVDLHLAGRFGLSYAGPAGVPRRPVVVHRAVLSTMERLVAHLLEVHRGALPPWLAPVQVALLPVEPESGEQNAACAALRDRLVDAGLRAEIDGGQKTLSARVRSVQHRKIPYAAIIGAREVADGTAALRLRDGRRHDPLPVAEVLSLVQEVARSRSHTLLPTDADRTGPVRG